MFSFAQVALNNLRDQYMYIRELILLPGSARIWLLNVDTGKKKKPTTNQQLCRVVLRILDFNSLIGGIATTAS